VRAAILTSHRHRFAQMESSASSAAGAMHASAHRRQHQRHHRPHRRHQLRRLGSHAVEVRAATPTSPRHSLAQVESSASSAGEAMHASAQ
jgi:hypothetical protein